MAIWPLDFRVRRPSNPSNKKYGYPLNPSSQDQHQARDCLHVLRDDGALEIYGVLEDLIHGKQTDPSPNISPSKEGSENHDVPVILAALRNPFRLLHTDEKAFDAYFAKDGSLAVRTVTGLVLLVDDVLHPTRHVISPQRCMPPTNYVGHDARPHSRRSYTIAFGKKGSDEHILVLLDERGKLICHRSKQQWNREVYELDVNVVGTRAHVDGSSASESNQGHDQHQDSCAMLALSPCGKFLAMIMSSGCLVIRMTEKLDVDLARWEPLVFSDNKSDSHPWPQQIEWCGSESVGLVYQDSLALVSIDGQCEYESYPVAESKTGALLIYPEIDGLRILCPGKNELIEKVNVETARVFSVASDHESAVLYSICSTDPLSENQDPLGMPLQASVLDRFQSIETLFREGTLLSAASTCAAAACLEWDVALQKSLLYTASLGLRYWCGLHTRFEKLGQEQRKPAMATLVRDMISRSCAVLRVLNAFRRVDTGLILTRDELLDVTLGVAVDRLSQYCHHTTAIGLSVAAGGTALDKVLGRWIDDSVDILVASKNSEIQQERWQANYALRFSDTIAQYEHQARISAVMAPSPWPLLPSKKDSLMSDFLPNSRLRAELLGYAADLALQRNEPSVAKALAEHGVENEKQIQLLMSMNQWQAALSGAMQSQDPDLLWRVFSGLLLCTHERGYDELDSVKQLVLASPEALRFFLGCMDRFRLLAGLKSLPSHSGGAGTEISSQDMRIYGDVGFSSSVVRKLTEDVLVANLRRRAHGSVEAADMEFSKCVSYLSRGPLSKKYVADMEISALKSEQAVMQVAAELESQLKLPAGSLAGSGSSDFISLVLKRMPPNTRWDRAVKMRKELKIPDRRFCWICLKTLSALNQTEDMRYLCFKVFGKAPPIGFAPFVEECLKLGDVTEAATYARLIPDLKERVKALAQCGQESEALALATKLKDESLIQQIPMLARKTS